MMVRESRSGGLGVPYRQQTSPGSRRKTMFRAVVQYFWQGLKTAGVARTLDRDRATPIRPYSPPGQFDKIRHKRFANVDTGLNLLIRPANVPMPTTRVRNRGKPCGCIPDRTYRHRPLLRPAIVLTS